MVPPAGEVGVRVVLTVLLLILVALVDGDTRDLKVIGGSYASQRDFPYQVVLHAGGQLCGGTIIAPQFILTAAHCVYSPTHQRLQPAQISVGIGTLDRTTAPGFRVTQIILSPDYRSDTQQGVDFALLRLARNITFSDNVQRVILASPSDKDVLYRRGSTVIVSGWGNTVHNAHASSISRYLRYATLRIVADNDPRCPLHPTQYGHYLCADDAVKSACGGDSGGPLVMKLTGNTNLLVGVVSFGLLACNTATAFTYVASIRSIIERVTGPLPYISRPDATSPPQQVPAPSLPPPAAPPPQQQIPMPSASPAPATARRYHLAAGWGQNKVGVLGLSQEGALSQYCSEGIIDVFLVGYTSLLNGSATFTSISTHCKSELVDSSAVCAAVGVQVNACRAAGKRVLLVIKSVQFASADEAKQAARSFNTRFVTGIVTDKVRPFGDGTFNGITLDLETTVPFLLDFLQEFRAANPSVYLTGAVQCSTWNVTVQSLMSIYKQAPLDALFVRFYNAPCTLSSNGFNFGTWQSFVAGLNPTPRLLVGVPAHKADADADNNGFTDASQLDTSLRAILTQDAKVFGGVLLSDAALAEVDAYAASAASVLSALP